MTCKQMETCLIPYLDRKLPAGQRAAVERHLAACAACSERVRGFSEVASALGEWREIEPSPFFQARLEQRMAQEAVASGWQEGWFGRWALLPAANPTFAVALLGMVSLAIWLLGYRPAPSETLASQQESALTATLSPGVDDLALYRQMPLLEDWELLRNFELLQELNGANP